MKMYKVNGFVRISKANAMHRFDAGETIYLCPHILRPGEPWHPEAAIVKNEGDDFKKIVSEFRCYNCNLSVGDYPAYYIKES